jgi:superfamily II DNA/RNA helicase
MAQVAREKAMARFREGVTPVLVATDVAARGIDVSGITHVINYHCPDDHKTYLHRIGRTGRAGATGIAITFVDWNDVSRWQMINRELELPFDQPEETYSTSERLYHDLGIPRGATGRVVPATQGVSRPDTAGRGGTDRGGGRGDRTRPTADRPRRQRSRNRTRGGTPVEAAGVSGATSSSGTTESASAADGERSSRRRRRGRSGSGSGAGPSTVQPE